MTKKCECNNLIIILLVINISLILFFNLFFIITDIRTKEYCKNEFKPLYEINKSNPIHCYGIYIYNKSINISKVLEFPITVNLKNCEIPIKTYNENNFPKEDDCLTENICYVKYIQGVVK